MRFQRVGDPSVKAVYFSLDLSQHRGRMLIIEVTVNVLPYSDKDFDCNLAAS